MTAHLIAVLIDRNKISFEDVKRAAKAIDEMDEAAIEELERKHKI